MEAVVAVVEAVVAVSCRELETLMQVELQHSGAGWVAHQPQRPLVQSCKIVVAAAVDHLEKI